MSFPFEPKRFRAYEIEFGAGGQGSAEHGDPKKRMELVNARREVALVVGEPDPVKRSSLSSDPKRPINRASCAVGRNRVCVRTLHTLFVRIRQ